MQAAREVFAVFLRRAGLNSELEYRCERDGRATTATTAGSRCETARGPELGGHPAQSWHLALGAHCVGLTRGRADIDERLRRGVHTDRVFESSNGTAADVGDRLDG